MNNKLALGLFVIVVLVGATMGLIGYQEGYINGLKDGETTTIIHYNDGNNTAIEDNTITENNTIIENNKANKTNNDCKGKHKGWYKDG